MTPIIDMIMMRRLTSLRMSVSGFSAVNAAEQEAEGETGEGKKKGEAEE